MPATYEAIASFTVTIDGTTPITFSSIPATYTDLRLVLLQQSPAGNVNSYAGFRYNGDSTTTYSVQRMYSAGGTPGYQSSQNSTDISPGLAVWASTSIPLLINMDIMDYRNSKYKTCLVQLSQVKGDSGWNAQTCHAWEDTSAITSITIFEQQGNGFGIGTSAVLYGIKAA